MVTSAARRNHILAGLPDAILDRLFPHLVEMPLPLRQVLHKPHQTIEYVFFPVSGISSQIAGSADDRVEVGLIGCDGMTGLSVPLGAETMPHECFVQIAGEALRMPAAELHNAFESEPALRKQILLYTREFLLQVAQTALANGRCTVEERLARWLLMCQDRLDSDEILLTHEFLSLMLGVRRPGVTIAINTLEKAAIVRNSRGRITILDREKLEEIAGDAYTPLHGETR